MPKLKSNKSVRKRFKITSTGKVKRHQANKRHLLKSKSARRKAQLRTAKVVIRKKEQEFIKHLIPYGA